MCKGPESAGCGQSCAGPGRPGETLVRLSDVEGTRPSAHLLSDFLRSGSGTQSALLMLPSAL